MSTIARLRGRAAVSMSLLAVLVGGFFVFEVQTAAPASAATYSTQALYCRNVKQPPTLPWYRCVNLGTMPAGSLPDGCYSTWKRVCD